MEDMYLLVEEEVNFEKTLDLRKILGSRILSKNGIVVGRIKQVRLNPETEKVEGVIVSRGWFRQNMYIEKSFFDRLSYDAIILNVDPVIMLKGRKIVTSEGEVIGKVKQVDRKGNTNDAENITTHSFLRGTFIIPASYVKYVGQSIILKPTYNVPKKYFWQKSR